MKKQEFVAAYVAAVEQLGLKSSEVAVTAGGALLMLGLREETDDLDLDIPLAAFEQLAKTHPVKMFGDSKVIDIAPDVSVHISKGEGVERTPEGVYIVGLWGLIRLKNKISRLPERNAAKVAADLVDLKKLTQLVHIRDQLAGNDAQLTANQLISYTGQDFLVGIVNMRQVHAYVNAYYRKHMPDVELPVAARMQEVFASDLLLLRDVSSFNMRQFAHTCNGRYSEDFGVVSFTMMSNGLVQYKCAAVSTLAMHELEQDIVPALTVVQYMVDQIYRKVYEHNHIPTLHEKVKLRHMLRWVKHCYPDMMHLESQLYVNIPDYCLMAMHSFCYKLAEASDGDIDEITYIF